MSLGEVHCSGILLHSVTAIMTLASDPLLFTNVPAMSFVVSYT